MSHLELFWHDAVQTIVGRYMMIAQYGERRRKGVVMVSEEENGDGWASISLVFPAFIDSFVTRDKVKHQIVEEGSRQGMTYARVTANLQRATKERSDPEGG